MTRECIAAFLCVVLVACGDDGGEAMDAGAGDGAGPAACTRFLVQGAVGGDGSAAAPHGTLDEVFAAAVAGDVVCAVGGEYAPPSAPLTVPLTIRGEGSAETLASTVVTADLGTCQTVSLLSEQRAPTTDRVDTEVALHTTSALRLESLVVVGCAVGISAVGTELELDDVRVQNVFAGVHAETGRVQVVDSILQGGTMPPPFPSDGPTTSALFASGADVVVTGTELVADGALVGLYSFGSNVDVADTRFDGGVAGFFLTGEPTNDIRIGPGTEVSVLRSASTVIPRNVVIGGEVVVDGLRVVGSQGLALGIGESANATVRNVALEAEEGLLLSSSVVTIEGVNTIDSSFRSVIVGGEEAPTSVVLDGELTSASRGAHVVVLDNAMAGEIEIRGSVEMTGGDGGLLTFGPRSTARVPGTLVARSQAVASVAAYAGTIELAAADLEGARWGIFAQSDARVTVDGARIAGMGQGVETRDTAALVLTDTVVEGSRLQGVVIGGAGGSINGGSVSDSGGVGVVVSAGVTIDGTTVRGNGGIGVEVQDAGTLTVERATFDSNVGAAVSFRGVDGMVAESTFAGTLPDADGRADEILLESTGTDAEVTVRANQFDLTVARTCTGTCSVFLASGPGAVGIVMPNCLRASPGEASTFTLVDQNGASFVTSPGLIWTGLNAGVGSDLGLAFGSAAAVPSDPAALALGGFPDVFTNPM